MILLLQWGYIFVYQKCPVRRLLSRGHLHFWKFYEQKHWLLFSCTIFSRVLVEWSAWKIHIISPAGAKGRFAYSPESRDSVRAQAKKSSCPLQKIGALQAQCCSPVMQPFLHWLVGSGTRNGTRLVFWLLPWAIKSFISDPGVSYLLFVYMKQWQATLLACKYLRPFILWTKWG